ncbi:MAG: GNAT family N-acetyltransferase [Clostridia bacterium]|nr:GNAT family N-acetyltransferase [Clostridia bacterium]
MQVRCALEKDIPRIGELLSQVNLVHHLGRPDLFKKGRKYSDGELCEIIKDGSKPILVAVDESDTVQGYCFCILQQHIGSQLLTDIKTLYIDDLCVDEKLRGKHVGSELYGAALRLARDMGCYNLTLNVWSCNPSAMEFYKRMGLVPQKVGMELIL